MNFIVYKILEILQKTQIKNLIKKIYYIQKDQDQMKMIMHNL